MGRLFKIVRVLPVLFLILLPSLTAIAQPANYCIRVTHTTNLRQSYSTKSGIVETVPAGTTLRVVYEGTRGNWLKIERNGKQSWMGRWLDHSRVDCGGVATSQSQPETPTQTEGSVDNCCFIGWQCNTPQEWEKGYHAFQNNQCTASETQSASEPETDSNTYQLPRGCYESYRFEGRYFATVSITCESPEKITEPVPLSFFSGDCYISSRSSYYSNYFDEWTTWTTYWCD